MAMYVHHKNDGRITHHLKKSCSEGVWKGLANVHHFEQDWNILNAIGHPYAEDECLVLVISIFLLPHHESVECYNMSTVPLSMKTTEFGGSLTVLPCLAPPAVQSCLCVTSLCDISASTRRIVQFILSTTCIIRFGGKWQKNCAADWEAYSFVCFGWCCPLILNTLKLVD